MSGYRTTPKADDDLIEGARWIRADDPQAARRFLDATFDAFDRLAEFSESGPLARFKNRKLAAVRFCVLPPPFNRWLIFYQLRGGDVEIIRVNVPKEFEMHINLNLGQADAVMYAADLTEAYVDYNKGDVTDPTTLGG